MSKTKKRKWILWLILIIGIVSAFLITATALRQRAAEAANIASMKTVQAEIGTITRTVSGTGSLQTVDTMEVKAITGVKVDEVLVKTGEEVVAGQALATLDNSRLATMVAEADIMIRQMDAELKMLSGKEADEYVNAPVEGRVKKILVQEGDRTADIIKTNDALMVLSTDGQMRVSFSPKADVATSTKVMVHTGDKKYSAKWDGVSKELCTVLLTDNGPLEGDVAIITTEDETVVLGEGILEINSPLEIIATGGNVKKIYVSENEKVSRGKSLIRLSDLPIASEYTKKLTDRAQKAADYAHLLRLMENPIIAAPADGVMSQVSITDGAYVATAAAMQNETEATVMKMNLKELKLDVGVDELDMPLVQVGQQATISFDALEDQEFTAVVESLSSLGQSANGVTKYTVTMGFEQAKGLYAGMNATATIMVEKRENVLVLPIESLQEDNEGSFVYMDSGKPGEFGAAKAIKTGLSDGKLVEITEGLNKGETIMYRIKNNGSMGFMFGPGTNRSPFGRMRSGE